MSCVHQWLSERFFNMLILFASSTWPGRLFLIATILFVKKCLRRLYLQWFWISLFLLPRVLESLLKPRATVVHASYFRLIIFYTSIISPLILLNFKVGSLSFLSLSIYDKFFTKETNFVALICTFSILGISSFLYGHHTETIYSSCDLIIALYNIQSDISEWCMVLLYQ